MKTTILTCLFITIHFCTLLAQEVNIEQFEERSLSNLASPSRNRALEHNSLTHWNVAVRNKGLEISPVLWKEPKADTIFFPVDSSCFLNAKGRVVSKRVFNGWIVATRCGEYGKMRWYSQNGKETYILTNSPYQRILDYRNKIIAFHNASHMGFNSGGLSELYFHEEENKWKLKSIYSSSDSYPVAIDSDEEGNSYIVTSSGLVKITPEKEVKHLVKGIYGSPLSTPNSIAIFNNSIYLGMAGGILKITEKNGSVEVVWLEHKSIN